MRNLIVNVNASIDVIFGYKGNESFWIVWFVVSVLIVILNGVVLSLLVWYRKEQKLRKIYFQLSGLCICDVFTGISLSLFALPLPKPFNGSKDACAVVIVSLLLSQIASQVNVFGLTLRRYVSLRNLRQLSVPWTRKHTYILYAAVVVVDVAFLVTEIYLIQERETDDLDTDKCKSKTIYGENVEKLGLINMVLFGSFLVAANVLGVLCIRMLGSNVDHDVPSRNQQHIFEESSPHINVDTSKNTSLDVKSTSEILPVPDTHTINKTDDPKANTSKIKNMSESIANIPTAKSSKDCKRKPKRTTREKMERSATKSLICVLICINLCVLPYVMSALLVATSVIARSQVLLESVVLSPFLNSLFNPFIYVIQVKAFRSLIWSKKSFRHTVSQRTSSERY